jgi:hypothetical protein
MSINTLSAWYISAVAGVLIMNVLRIPFGGYNLVFHFLRIADELYFHEKKVRIELMNKTGCCSLGTLNEVYILEYGELLDMYNEIKLPFDACHHRTRFVTQAGLFKLIEMTRIPLAENLIKLVDAAVIPQILGQKKTVTGLLAELECRSNEYRNEMKRRDDEHCKELQRKNDEFSARERLLVEQFNSLFDATRKFSSPLSTEHFDGSFECEFVSNEYPKNPVSIMDIVKIELSKKNIAYMMVNNTLRITDQYRNVILKILHRYSNRIVTLSINGNKKK